MVDDSLTITPILPDATEPALRWLRVWFDRKLNFRRHVAIRAAKARKVAAHIRSLAKTTCGPPACSLRKAVITCVLPRLLYGSEAWYGGRTRTHTTVRGTKTISTRLGWHVAIIEKTLALAAKGVLPVYRTTPTTVLFREAGLPSGHVALENAKLCFAVHLQTVDHSHPLAQRMKLPTIQRGTGAGGPQQPRTKVQRLGGLLQPVPRPLLVPPHYTPGCGVDPTGGLEKKVAAENFKLWWKHLSPQDVTIFSDGSEQYVEGIKHVIYGYAIYQNQRLLRTGRGSLNSRSHVFDAEAVGAWQGLRDALNDPTLRMQRL